jgi:hypothetical protein
LDNMQGFPFMEKPMVGACSVLAQDVCILVNSAVVVSPPWPSRGHPCNVLVCRPVRCAADSAGQDQVGCPGQAGWNIPRAAKGGAASSQGQARRGGAAQGEAQRSGSRVRSRAAARAQPHPVPGEPAALGQRGDGGHALPAVHRLQGGAPRERAPAGRAWLACSICPCVSACTPIAWVSAASR